MALVVAFAFAVVMVGILALTRLFSTRVAGALTVLYGALTVAAFLLLDVGGTPGGNIAGTLLALTVLSLAHVGMRLRRQRRYAARARRPQEVSG